MNSGNTEKIPERFKWIVKVSARGHLDYLIEDCFDGMEITDSDDGTTIIEGSLSDLPEVYGFIIRLRDAMVFLNSLQVVRIEVEGPGR